VVYAHLEAHEHWGTYALLSADLLGGLALVSLIVDLKCKTCGWLRVLVVLMALVTAALMAQTAYSGGLIRHPEIHRSIGTDMNQL
jgi:hypothetical protein